MPILRPQREAIEGLASGNSACFSTLEKPSPKNLSFKLNGGTPLFFLGISRPNNTKGCDPRVFAVFGKGKARKTPPENDWADLAHSCGAVVLSVGKKRETEQVTLLRETGINGTSRKVWRFVTTRKKAEYPRLVTS